MGKKFAPSYANIYMADWEETVLPKCTKLPVGYYRYLDDIWGIWEHGKESFEKFIHILNDHHRLIKVKTTTNHMAINFLNTTVFKGPNFNTSHQLDTKMYFKETDTHAVLHHKSFHPKHTFEEIVRAQLVRFSRICTREEDFQEAKRVLFRSLRTRGYSKSKKYIRNILINKPTGRGNKARSNK